MIVNLCYCQAKKTKEEAAQMNAQILCAVSATLLYVHVSLSLYNKYCIVFFFIDTQ